MRQKSVLVAFIFWLFGLALVCGLHRFYVGKVGTGILWLLTLGLLGIGQLIDLFLLGSLVREANMRSALGAFASAQSNASAGVSNVINVTVQAPPATGGAPAPTGATAPQIGTGGPQPQLQDASHAASFRPR